MAQCFYVNWRGRAGTHAVHSAPQFLLSRCLTAGRGWLELRHCVVLPFAERVPPTPQTRCWGLKDDRLRAGLSTDGEDCSNLKENISSTSGRRQVSGELTGSWVWRQNSSLVTKSQHIWVMPIVLFNVFLSTNSILRQIEKKMFF